MNKQTTQAFALGILFSVLSVYAGTTVMADKEPKPEITVSSAKDLLETKGYKVLNSDELSKLTKNKDDDAKGKSAVEKEEAKPKEEVKEAEKPKEEVKEEKKFTLVIASGMSPGDIAVMLKSQGIIEEKEKFERYLIDQGFHTKIQIGQYDLTGAMDYYQIAKIITKNR